MHLMNSERNGIWLDKDYYPDCQESEYTYFDERRGQYPYVLAELCCRKKYPAKIVKAEIDIFADVRFWLYMNGVFVGTGPVCAGGDYGNTRPMPVQYYNTYEIGVDSKDLDLYVMVQKNVIVQCDMSKGRPGLVLQATLTFEDGTNETVTADGSWQGRINRQRYAQNGTDYTRENDPWRPVQIVDNVWNLKPAPIPNLVEETIRPGDFAPITVQPGQIQEILYDFDRIYSCYHSLQIRCAGPYEIEIYDYEKDEIKTQLAETIAGDGDASFRGLQLRSVGTVQLKIRNLSDKELILEDYALLFQHYPVVGDGDFRCSDEALNRIYEMGKWALRICRQTIELDSPKHQENLGCTGDYYIASLMNYFADGDTALTRLDLVRTADYLKMSHGYMFHTTYSMIWIRMLWDYYQFTADERIFAEARDGLTALLERFAGYTDERGIVTNPDSYMFLDWLEVDGLSLHHPPAALGQAALNAFYYGGLQTAGQIFTVLGDRQWAERCAARADRLKQAFNECFYDTGRGLYCDGLNEPNEPKGGWLPANVGKRYFSWHTNTLAVLFDLAPERRQRPIMERILNDMSLINPQPYFMHFVLDAIWKTGLFEKYGMAQIRRWQEMTAFPKGLQEGWYDISGYGFDYSHVWGGTPTYQLPARLSGLEMIEPGFRKIRLNPRLYGLQYADIRIPTPFGAIKLSLKEGVPAQIDVPEGIQLVS